MSTQSRVIRIRKTEYDMLEARRRQAVMAAGGVFVSHAEVMAELLRELVDGYMPTPVPVSDRIGQVADE